MNLFHVIHLLSAAWAAAGELITAGALLWCLSTLANLIRWTYAAGAAVGAIWFVHVWPFLRWLYRQIDWVEVRQGLIAFAALVITAAELVLEWFGTVRRSWIAWHDVVPTTVTPAINPLLGLAEELQELSCRQLRAEFGLKQRCGKQQLIALALAA